MADQEISILGPFSELSGIYRIVLSVPNKPARYYVGQTVRFRARWQGHLRSLRKGEHFNIRLQRAYNKYGLQSLTFEILLICGRDKKTLDLYEQLIVDSYDRKTLINLCRQTVGTRTGISSRRMTRQKISRALTGIIRSDETCVRISKAKRGWKPPPKHIEYLRWLGQHQPVKSIELRETIAAKLRGRKKPREEIARRQATRRANAEARGYWCTPSWVEKQRNRRRKSDVDRQRPRRSV